MSKITKDANTARRNNARNRNNRSRHDNRPNDATDDCKTGSIRNDFKGSVHNDPAWYSTVPELVTSSASISYSRAIGTKFERGCVDLRDVGFDDAIPGVATFRFVTTPGMSDSGDSPIMMAARNIYSFVRHQNSGSKNYEAVDLMLYLLAMDSVYTMLATAVRAYGVARLYSQGNRYLPDALLSSMGFDPVSFSGNLEDFRGRINVLINKAGSMAVPDSMSYFKRHTWMASHVFTDSPNTFKSQLYMYHPAGYYTYSPIEDETGGKLVWNNLPGAPDTDTITYVEFCNKINTMLAALVEDEDSNVMSGDILKAFGGDKLFRMNYIATDYMVMPEYSPEVLTQINNITICGPLDAYHADISQENGIIMYLPEFHIHALRTGKLILNMPMEQPTPIDTMVATRLMVAFDSGDMVEDEGAHNYLWKPSSLGSEFISRAGVTVYTWINGFRQLVMKTFNQFHAISYEEITDWSETIKTLADYAYFSNFVAHPRIYTSVGNTEMEDIALPSMGDTGTFALVGSYELDNMHTTALLSEFNVPLMGVWSQK